MPEQIGAPSDADSPDRLRAKATRVRHIVRTLLDDRAATELLLWADELDARAAALEATEKDARSTAHTD